MKSNDFILTEARALLDRADAHHERSRYEERLPLSPIWAGDNREKKRGILSGSASAAQAVEALQAYWFQQIPPPREAGLAVDWHLACLRVQGNPADTLPEFCQESLFAPEEAIVRRDGQRYRPDFFRHLGTMLRLRRAVADTRLTRVLELGAGTGNLARQFLGWWPNLRYVIIDLPDTLVFSFMYLRLNFPEKTWVFVQEDESPSTEELAAADFVFCPVSLQDRVLSLDIDLFVNTASLGEMTADTVRHWFDVVQNRVRPRWLVSINRYLNTLVPGRHDWRLHENTTAMRFGAHWQIRDWELEPDYLRCPYNNKHARQLLVIAEAGDAAPAAERRQLSLDYTEDARAGSWNQPPLEMTHQDNVLVSDMTRTGILFRLWESLRLDERTDNLELMLAYLDTLCHNRDRHFEEYFQYRQRAEILAGRAGRLTSDLPGDASSAPEAASTVPLLVGSTADYNVVRFGSTVFGLPKRLGPVDLAHEDPRGREGVIVGSSVGEVMGLLERAAAPA